MTGCSRCRVRSLAAPPRPSPRKGSRFAVRCASGSRLARSCARRPPGGAGRLTIARIWGIPISVHASWLLVFALVAGSLAAGYFPAQHPEWGGPTRWVLGALTRLAFFASVLVHE